MKTSVRVGNLLKEKGLRQAWVVDKMNRIAPDLNMSKVKFSAIVCGNRKITGDELIAFCLATGTNLDYFYNTVISQDTA